MQLKEISLEQFSAFTQEYPELASVFNSQNWMELFGGKLQCFGILDGQGKTTAGFYLFRDKIKGFTFYRNPPFTPHNGFVFANSGKNPAKRMSKEKKVMAAMADYMEKLARKHIVTVSLPTSVQDVQPFIWKDFKVVPHFTYLHDLTKSKEELFDCFSPETRNSIRKAEQDGAVADHSHNPNLAKELVVKNLDTKSANAERKWLEKLFGEFLTPENSFMTFTQKGKETLSVAVCVFDSRSAYYIFGGVDPQINNTGAGPLGIWNSIILAKEKGLQLFDFEGSMIPGVEHFFRSFGGVLTPYYTINKASFWKEVLLKKVRRNKF